MRVRSFPWQACKLPEGRTLSEVFNLCAICVSMVFGTEKVLGERKQLVELVSMKSKHQEKHKYVVWSWDF